MVRRALLLWDYVRNFLRKITAAAMPGISGENVVLMGVFSVAAGR